MLLEKVEIHYPEESNIAKHKKLLKEKYGNDIEFTVEKHTIQESQQEWSWRSDSSFTTYRNVTKTWLICEK